MAEYLISWDTNGVEAVVPIGAMHEENVLAKLQGQSPKHNIGSIYYGLTLRARFNPQRSPQIWGINIDDELDEKTLRKIADTTPQVLVDLVKEKGVMFYGDEMQKNVIDY